MNRLTELGKRAKAASRTLSCASTAQKNAALAAIADALCAHIPEILAANEEDLKAAAQNGMSESLQDRLRLTAARIEGIAGAVRDLIGLPDPIGQVIDGGTRPNGLKIEKVRTPDRKSVV